MSTARKLVGRAAYLWVVVAVLMTVGVVALIVNGPPPDNPPPWAERETQCLELTRGGDLYAIKTDTCFDASMNVLWEG